jgi:C4-dicarboxylate transporter, DctM subunit
LGTLVFFSAFAIFIFISVPIALALALACTAFLYATNSADLIAAFPRYLIAGLDKFVLLSIPLFILAGSLMSQGGITDRILGLARALIGRVPGGLAQISIIACMLFGGVVGSASAETAAIGSVMIPAMERDGYPNQYAAGLISVASVMGPIIPPSIAMIIYGVLTGTSIASLFIAGIIPGIMIGGSLAGYAYWMAKRHGHPVSPPMDWKMRLRLVADGLPAAMLPVIILGGILSGVFTPTESAAIAVLYALVLSAFFYRTLTPKTLYRVLWETAFITAGIMIVVATSNMVAFVFAMEGLPQKVANGMLAISHNKDVILLLINILLLILGMFLDLIAIMILTLPVLIVIVKSLGIDLVHFGLIVTINVVIGLVTPPVGMCLFVASSISRLPIEEISRATLPMLAICFGVLMIVTYVPAVTLFLPSFFR